jgi:hypothetical protein
MPGASWALSPRLAVGRLKPQPMSMSWLALYSLPAASFAMRGGREFSWPMVWNCCAKAAFQSSLKPS